VLGLLHRDNFLGRTPMRDTLTCMAKNLGSQQELIVLSVLHTPSETEICNFSPILKREHPGPPPPECLPLSPSSSIPVTQPVTQEFNCFSEKQELFQLPMGIDP